MYKCVSDKTRLQGAGGSYSDLGHGDTVKFTISDFAVNVTFLEIRLKTVNVDYIQATPNDFFGNPLQSAVC